MLTTTEPLAVIAWAGAAFLFIAVVRVYFVLTEGGEFVEAQWRRRWIEVGFLGIFGAALALISFFLRYFSS